MKAQLPLLRTATLLIATLGVAALAVARPGLSPSEAATTPTASLMSHANHAAMAGRVAKVNVKIREWQVTPSTRIIPSGRVTFIVRNAGRKPHEFKVVKAHGSKVKGFARKHDRAVLSGVRGGLRPLRPGETRRLTITLPRGRYVLMCNLVGHYRRAKIPMLRVKASTARTPAPAATGPAATGPAAKGDTTLQLSTAGILKFDTAALTAPEGRVTIVLTNKEVLPHNVAIKGNGVDAKGPEVGQGKTSSVSADLAPGVYTFYCSVSGHEASGMKGRLTITSVSRPNAPLPDPGPDPVADPGTGGVVGGGGGGGGGGGSVTPPPSGALSLSVTGLFAFSTNRLEAAPGPVSIVLTNNSPLTHNIAIRGNGVDVRGVEVGSGGQSIASATLAEGTYTFFCSVSGHEASGMTGTLAVTPTAGGGGGGSGGGGGGGSGGGGDPTTTDGPTLFRGYCGGCHTLAATGSTGTVGPNLDDDEPNFDKVYKQVIEGEDPMPSFVGVLSYAQIRAVAEFVEVSTRGTKD